MKENEWQQVDNEHTYIVEPLAQMHGVGVWGGDSHCSPYQLWVNQGRLFGRCGEMGSCRSLMRGL